MGPQDHKDCLFGMGHQRSQFGPGLLCLHSRAGEGSFITAATLLHPPWVRAAHGVSGRVCVCKPTQCLGLHFDCVCEKFWDIHVPTKCEVNKFLSIKTYPGENRAYHQLGNAVCPPVIKAIAEAMLESLAVTPVVPTKRAHLVKQPTKNPGNTFEQSSTPAVWCSLNYIELNYRS